MDCKPMKILIIEDDIDDCNSFKQCAKNRDDIEYEVDISKYFNGGICGVDKHTKFAISSRVFSIYGNAPTLTACNTSDNSKIAIESEEI